MPRAGLSCPRMPPHLLRSIATVCLSGTLPDKLEAAASAGFDGVEIFEQDLLSHDGPPAGVRAMAADMGLAITLFQPFRDFEAMPDPTRARNLDRAERKFDVMEELGTDLVLVCSNTHPAALDDPARATADLREMAERAARRGLRVGYEALAWGRHVNRWRDAWDIVRAADHAALGLILDSFHTLSLDDDLAGLSDTVPAEKIAFVQLADAPRLSMDVLSWSRHHRTFPGSGELPVAAFLVEVLRAGYRGPLSHEIFNDEFRAAPARRIARDGLRSLVWLDSAVAAAAPQLPAAPLPPAPRHGGVAFLEFAVDETDGAALAAYLSALGFHRAGRHRSKAVELWGAGDASLILNAEPDSAAAAHHELHGPSACALGLRVDDAARALARAEALLCSAWRERVGAGERPLPGVRAPDGSLILLLDDESWRADFATDAAPAPPGPFLGVDHVAGALAPDQMDGAVLFHRSVLGLEPQPLWELPDPQGLVRSRALVDADSRLRLPLNVSESTRTATGRLVSALAGAGVHHVALAVADAHAAMSALVAAGAPVLRIPGNYYDDLAARFGLDDDRVAALQAANLLYDRDAAGGEFLHGYTQPFADRFFFEIVERRGGYRDFGAVNAAVRMAAQARSRPWSP